MDDDTGYLNDCLSANFFIFQNSIILSDISNFPSKKELEEHSMEEIEALHSHFHMSFISSNYESQKKYAFEIWNCWRLKISKALPNEQILITISDDGNEIVLTLKRLAPDWLPNFSYDPCGNFTHYGDLTFDYDALDHLIRVKTPEKTNSVPIRGKILEELIDKLIV